MTGPRSYSFTQEGGTQTFAFACNRDWSISSSDSWLRVSPTSGKAAEGDIMVTLTVSPNSTYDSRTATLTLMAEGLSETISVAQDMGLGLIVSPTSFDLTNEAQTIEIEVQKNVSYSIMIDETCKEWIKQGGTRALSADKVSFYISANNTYDNREGRITVKQTDGSLFETIVVKQSQTNGLFVSPSEFSLTRESHSIEVTLESNVNYEVICELEWIHIVSTKALSSNVISLIVDANETFEQRVGIIRIIGANGLLEGCITISQEPDEAIAFEDSKTKQICVSNWDTNNDGELSILEASRVQSIGQVFKESTIKSFNEFRYFVSVTEVGYLSFFSSSIKEIVFPEGITIVGQEAFSYCRLLSTLVLNEKLVEIGSWAFNDCISLSIITLPSSLQTLGDQVFRGTPVRRIIIPDSIINLDSNPFPKCISLEEISGKYSTPDKRCLIKDGKLLSFASKGITKYSFPPEVKEVGDCAFWGLSSIEELSFPSDTHTFGEMAFEDCSSLKTVTLENQGSGVTQLGSMLFQQCSSLRDFDISKATNLTELPNRLFFRCYSLKQFTIPKSVEIIRNQAFIFCSSLMSVYCLPIEPPLLYSTYSRESDVFEGTPNNMKVYVNPGSVDSYKNAYTWSDYANRIQAMSQPTNVIYYTSSDRSIVTPKDVFGSSIVSNEYVDAHGIITFDGPVTIIGDEAFAECRSLTSITIPKSVSSIGDSAFDLCSSLTSITIPDGVTSIGDKAFRHCGLLSSITLPEGIISIGVAAFQECRSLTSITIPKSVSSIGDSAFDLCYSLTSINIPDGVTSIGEYTFGTCYSLTDIIIPKGVTSIGDFAFNSCFRLASITIPDSVTIIGNGAFQNCYALDNIRIPNNVKSIGFSAFRYCKNLTSVFIPESVTAIGQSAFSECVSLKSFSGKFASEDGLLLIKEGKLISVAISSLDERVTIPEGVTTIGPMAFSKCSNLTGINIPNSVTRIEAYAFSECSSLTSITIPESVTTIESFGSCPNLTSIIFLPVIPPTLDVSALDWTNNAPIFVPASSLESYKSSMYWRKYANRIQAISL